jgi:16S rRNA (adenine1518-N6/adenine1519-N6)-dimethyltransferase
MKRRRLGQHYLVDQEVINKIVALAKIGPAERVVEIGTGRGALTRVLVDLGASYLGFEVDRRNFEETVRAVNGARAQIRLADAFQESPEFDVLVSSLPYSESSTFIEWLCGIDFGRAVVVLQEDFVRKVIAPPGSRNYRGISALAQLSFDIQVIGRVRRDSFAPQPRVSSVIAVLSPKRRVPKAEVSNIMRLFSLRRRRVDSALAELGMKWKAGQGTRRVNSLRPDEVHQICGPRGPA